MVGRVSKQADDIRVLASVAKSLDTTYPDGRAGVFDFLCSDWLPDEKGVVIRFFERCEKCHRALAKKQAKYVSAVLKNRTKCQKTAEKGGATDTSGCVAGANFSVDLKISDARDILISRSTSFVTTRSDGSL